METTNSKLDMSLDDIVKQNFQQNRQNRGVKRLDNNQRHSFPSNGMRRNNQMNGSGGNRMRSNYNNNNNNFNNGGGFRTNNTQNRSTFSGRTKGTIQIGNLSIDVNEDDLNQLFAPIGDLESVQIMYDHTGTSRGVAKVVFRQLQDAMDAVEKYNNVRLDGNPMKMFMVQDVQAVGQQRSFSNNNNNQQNRRTDGNRFVRQFDNQRPMNNRPNTNGNFRTNNNNNRNFNNRPMQRHSTGNFNNNNRRQFQNNGNSNNNKPKEVNREDLDRDLEEFLASR